ncbi:MAG: SufS family cysteine desulfurase [Phycisphaerales bacterium]|nr:MAG: SufS family cysteine desulfurase [Phycisphaerales bacterium]
MNPARQPSTAPGSPGALAFDPEAIRAQFPMLGATMNGKPLVYLDNAATTQRPRAVIDSVVEHWSSSNGPVSRGVHALGSLATEKYESARTAAAALLNAEPETIVFTKGVTDGLNLVARSLGDELLGEGDEVVVTELEHHSNFLPWRQACLRRGAVLRVAPITDSGELDMDALRAMVNERTRIVAVTHVSNVLGTVVPVSEIVSIARGVGAAVVVDGAQAPGHLPVDVQRLGCDFYATSAHKMFGPAGVGTLFMASQWVDRLEPAQFGGGMVELASAEESTWITGPHRFEAGTPNTEGAVGLASAVAFLGSFDRAAARAHEHALRDAIVAGLGEIPNARVYAPADGAPIVSFGLEGVHAHDLATVLDAEGVAVRAGHMCCQPLMRRLGVPALTRASIAPYNTHAEVEALLDGVRRAGQLFA